MSQIVDKRPIEKLITEPTLNDILKDFLEKHTEEIKKMVQVEVLTNLKKLADNYQGELKIEAIKNYLDQQLKAIQNK